MTVMTTAGSTLGISASTPATFNQAGYEALTFTSVGEITDFGQFGRVYNIVTHNPVSTRGTQKLKGSFNEGQVSLQLGLDNSDAGQDLIRTASTSDSAYSFKITLQNGNDYYFQGLVSSFAITAGSVDSVTSAAVNIEITTNGSTGIVLVE